MKSLLFALVLLLGVIAPDHSSEAPAFPAPAALLAPTSTVMWVPSSFQVNKQRDGSITVKPSSGWQYVGYGKNGKLRMGGLASKISCTCRGSGSGSCLPASGGGKVGCVMDGCSSCLGETSIKFPDIPTYQTVSSGGYVQRSRSARLARPRDLQNAAMVFEAMLEIPAIQRQLKAFLASIPRSGGKQANTLIRVGGRIAMVSAPATWIKEKGGIILANSASCSCTEGSCSLRTKIGGIKYCQGNCSGTCTLDTGIMDPGSGEPLEVLGANF